MSNAEQKIGIQRFIEAQNSPYAGYEQALKEITAGRKGSHWIWYIFPQMAGLGFSPQSQYYGIKDKEEAEEYLHTPLLHDRLFEITEALLTYAGVPAASILGSIDAIKVRSCMTLFDAVCPNSVFQQVLDTFFHGEKDTKTLKLLIERTSES